MTVLTIAYYRKKDTGEITHHHALPEDWPPEVVGERMNQYNSEADHKTIAYAIQVEAGSFEAYLLDCLEKKYKLAKEAIREALDAIDDARSCINCLEVEP